MSLLRNGLQGKKEKKFRIRYLRELGKKKKKRESVRNLPAPKSMTSFYARFEILNRNLMKPRRNKRS